MENTTNDTPANYAPQNGAMTAEVMIPEQQPAGVATIPGFQNKEAWELAQRQARALMASDIVPEQFRKNIGNCIIALDMAYRMGASPLMVMQNLYIVHGRPGWSAQFLIATFNQCGRFTAIRYKWNADKSECTATTTEKSTGEVIDGPKISIEMAKAEGWSTKNGSKWKTMPELMLSYRAAAFLIRTCAPEISMGLRTKEEEEDITASKQITAWGILTPTLMMQAVSEIENRIANADDVIAKAKLDPDGEQAAELRAVKIKD